MPDIFASDASEHVCPFNAFEPCLGSKCMAFKWNGPREDRCETDNLLDTPEGMRPVGDPKTPEGNGWLMDGDPFPKGYHRSEKDKLPKATAQRWTRPRELLTGYCGRVGADNPYF